MSSGSHAVRATDSCYASCCVTRAYSVVEAHPDFSDLSTAQRDAFFHDEFFACSEDGSTWRTGPSLGYKRLALIQKCDELRRSHSGEPRANWFASSEKHSGEMRWTGMDREIFDLVQANLALESVVGSLHKELLSTSATLLDSLAGSSTESEPSSVNGDARAKQTLRLSPSKHVCGIKRSRSGRNSTKRSFSNSGSSGSSVGSSAGSESESDGERCHFEVPMKASSLHSPKRSKPDAHLVGVVGTIEAQADRLAAMLCEIEQEKALERVEQSLCEAMTREYARRNEERLEERRKDRELLRTLFARGVHVDCGVDLFTQ